MKQNNHQINRWRIREGGLTSSNKDGNNGCFSVPGPNRQTFLIIASDGGGWDHVSVHVAGVNRCPTWEEMVFVKNLFFAPDEWVIQIHPPNTHYIDLHPYTLHLWRPQDQNIPVPPLSFV